MNQYGDFERGFHPLLSMVFIEDGHFRLFGTAVERGLIDLCIQGKGVQKEEGEEHVYRLTQKR
jgi:hypothetical protein